MGANLTLPWLNLIRVPLVTEAVARYRRLMTKDIVSFRMAVCSPSDVALERDIVRKVVEDINRSTISHGQHIHLVGWETDAHPAMDPLGPIGVTDKALAIPECDIVVFIFWSRFGSPVPGALSGTEHEFKQAVAASKATDGCRPHVMVYFKDAAVSPKGSEEAHQLTLLLSFKEKNEGLLLAGHFKDEADFERDLRNDINAYLGKNLVPRHYPAPDPSPTGRDWAERRLAETPIHTIFGLSEEPESREIFQDFRVDRFRNSNPNPVSYLWADVYRGNTINASLEGSDSPCLRVTFENRPDSYPGNIAVRPIGGRPIRANKNNKLILDLRQAPDGPAPESEVFFAVRIIDGWCRHLVHGNRGQYRSFQVRKEAFECVEIPLSHEAWWPFPADGNRLFAPQSDVDLTMIAGVVLEFGNYSLERLGAGRGTVLVRGIRIA